MRSTVERGMLARLLLALLSAVTVTPSVHALAMPRAACDAASFQTVLVSPPAGRTAVAAHAVWLDAQRLRWPQMPISGRYRLFHSASGQLVTNIGEPVRGADGAIALSVVANFSARTTSSVVDRFKYVKEGVTLAVRPADYEQLGRWHRGQLLVVSESQDGRVLAVAAIQIGGALDARYAAAGTVSDLGVTVSRAQTRFKVWAPTASEVSLCVYNTGSSGATTIMSMSRDARSGIWSASARSDLTGRYYTYLIEVYAPGVGRVRNRVTDPYSISLTTDSRRSFIAALAAPALKPTGWNAAVRPAAATSSTDMVIYELHVRDFSINDSTVTTSKRGKYGAFSLTTSQGRTHLQALANAGVTDVHLLPVFDVATVPESGCQTPVPTGAPDGTAQQDAVQALAAVDCYNWGYDPFHYTAPEGSFASDASNGATRILEFRTMVQSLHAMGLRVGMDVVYNHTSASGQKEKSVLDRIVPGYYHRLDAEGRVETSTCCDNTATENRMMAKLMIESAAVWAREYHIDSFRFDLMGHQPREAMERLQKSVDAAAGRHIPLIGEGWNFGEVANGARFEQASQLSLNGSGIGTFSDRARDAVRGGGPGDNGMDQISRQGYVTGLFYDRNASAPTTQTVEDLKRAADMVRVGLAGSLRTYALRTYRDERVAMERIDYAGQPAGYVGEPGEVVNYVENHDNQTLFDVAVFKLPVSTSREDRARVQTLAAATVALSQGVAYFHAGQELLRSKSMDRNSFDSGDWFNRLDWSFRDNYFGTGLPPKGDNGSSWPLMKPLLADSSIRPRAENIRWTRDAFYDLLSIRKSSTLFRLRSAQDINERLTFYNTGSAQVPTVIVGHLNGAGYAGAGFREILYAFNVDTASQRVSIDALKGRAFALHPVHLAAGAADLRARLATWNPDTGTLGVPPRTVVVWVVP